VQGSDDALSYNLSLERGRAIRDFLVLSGAEESSVTISAYGNVNTRKRSAPGVAVRFREK
jgi:outer membrane protein OmpA-like peptidoglycan-associated protein